MSKDPKKTSMHSHCAECGEIMPTIGICHCMEPMDYEKEEDYPDGYDEIDEELDDEQDDPAPPTW